mmetsp:Transcript_47106/g.100166  ORF Transcript_47106/g.100166 Transcript_47106/m.100166 type:complete len:410 (-) Transcript_47106:79-1308(-)
MSEDRRMEMDLCYSRLQFPDKVYKMLELADGLRERGCPPCVSWLSHGRAFKIHDEKEFMEDVVPLFFKQTKLRSFYRQLNLWEFRRVSRGVDVGAWHNEFFLRGLPNEIRKMVRIKIKGKMSRHNCPDDGVDPNFYSMPPLPPLQGDSKSATSMGVMMGSHVDSCRRISVESLTGMVGVMRGNGGRVSLEVSPSDERFQFHVNLTSSMRHPDHPQPKTPSSIRTSAASPSIITPTLSFHGVQIAPLCAPCSQNCGQGASPSLPFNRGMCGPWSRNSLDGSSWRFVRRSKFANNSTADSSEVERGLAAGLRPLSFGHSSPMIFVEELESKPMVGPEPDSSADEGVERALDELESRLMAQLKLKPFGLLSGTTSENDTENAPVVELEPLPFSDTSPSDEFADFIDRSIQML